MSTKPLTCTIIGLRVALGDPGFPRTALYLPKPPPQPCDRFVGCWQTRDVTWTTRIIGRKKWQPTPPHRSLNIDTWTASTIFAFYVGKNQHITSNQWNNQMSFRYFLYWRYNKRLHRIHGLHPPTGSRISASIAINNAWHQTHHKELVIRKPSSQTPIEVWLTSFRLGWRTTIIS